MLNTRNGLGDDRSWEWYSHLVQHPLASAAHSVEGTMAGLTNTLVVSNHPFYSPSVFLSVSTHFYFSLHRHVFNKLLYTSKLRRTTALWTTHAFTLTAWDSRTLTD